MKKLLPVLTLVLLLLLSACSSTMTDEQKDKAILDVFVKDGVEAAKSKAIELYKDNEDKVLAWMLTFNTTKSNNYKDKLVIQEGWNWEKDGNYTYVKGRVKNTGDKTISYFEITAEYLDKNGQVLDTDYTNSGENLRPSNQKEFKIMHRYDSQYEQVRIFVEEVRID